MEPAKFENLPKMDPFQLVPDLNGLKEEVGKSFGHI